MAKELGPRPILASEVAAFTDNLECFLLDSKLHFL